MSIIENMKWRHASKAMTGEKLPQDTIDCILEAINLTPTSLGLQAYKIFVVESQDIKEQIYNEACPQQPIVGCSHLLVFAARTDVDKNDLDNYFDMFLTQTNYGLEWVTKFRTKIENFLNNGVQDKDAWLQHQTYIALGVACVAAASERVASIPIEGFNKDTLNKILSLNEKGYAATVMLPLGVSDTPNDWWGAENKIRKDIDSLIEII